MRSGVMPFATLVSALVGCALDVADPQAVTDGSDEGIPPEAPCQVGLTRCGVLCADLSTDRFRCGSCGVHCLEGEECVEGSCVCEPGWEDCNGSCTRLTDERHCGACGNACASGEACVDGACTPIPCEGDLERCGFECADLSTHDLHCGSCETACGVHSTCVDGTCVCAAGRTVCGEECVDLSSDSNNCGACLRGCGDDSTCSHGVCTYRGGDGDGSCGGVCGPGCPFGCPSWPG